MKINIEFPRKLLEVYNDACKPLCKKLKLPQTAFDILMFLGNNPQYQTARDIVKIRNIKANLISINVEKLVKEGYLRREEIKGDQRKTKLLDILNNRIQTFITTTSIDGIEHHVIKEAKKININHREEK